MDTELILSAATDYASAWIDTDEQRTARIAFIHGVRWMQSKIHKVAVTPMDYKLMRIRAGLTLRDVAAATGLSNPYLSQLENCKIKKPSQYSIEKLNNFYSTLPIPE